MKISSGHKLPPASRLPVAACLIISLFCILVSGVNLLSARDFTGREYFQNGKNDLVVGRYVQAVKGFSMAEKEFGLLKDYALLYLSEAYHELGEHGKALDAIRRLLREEPLSPLRKKAKMYEIREAEETGDSKGDIPRLYESFLRDYPGTEEISFSYGRYLKETGEKAGAAAVFKEIYKGAGALSESAYAELTPEEIKSGDLVERASNLMKNYAFGAAERDLRKALLLDDGGKRDAILKKLGLVLFRQKKYKDAAEVYGRTGELYSSARSLYRAGDRQGFEEALNQLVESNSRKAGRLFVAVASDKRREKDYKNALIIYNDVLKKYPLEKEDAMWGIGWTNYLSGKYKKSSGVFAGLYAEYKRPKYLYWRAKSVDALGGDAAAIYDSLMKMDNNFYGVLSYAKNGKKFPGRVLPDNMAINRRAGGRGPGNFERIEALQSLGMHEEATGELIALSKNIGSPEEMISFILKFQELGEFNYAIKLAAGSPYTANLHGFWYPLAFWDIIERASQKYDIDPFVVLSVIREESRFDADAKSVAGALGLMQLMPRTAYRLDRELDLGINNVSQINDIGTNIYLGSYYLKSLFNEFDTLAYVLAAYNAGESIVRAWRSQGDYRSTDEFIEDIPYPETRNYVKKVITSCFQYKKYSAMEDKGTDMAGLLGQL